MAAHGEWWIEDRWTLTKEPQPHFLTAEPLMASPGHRPGNELVKHLNP